MIKRISQMAFGLSILVCSPLPAAAEWVTIICRSDGATVSLLLETELEIIGLSQETAAEALVWNEEVIAFANSMRHVSPLLLYYFDRYSMTLLTGFFGPSLTADGYPVGGQSVLRCSREF